LYNKLSDVGGGYTSENGVKWVRNQSKFA